MEDLLRQGLTALGLPTEGAAKLRGFQGRSPWFPFLDTSLWNDKEVSQAARSERAKQCSPTNGEWPKRLLEKFPTPIPA